MIPARFQKPLQNYLIKVCVSCFWTVLAMSGELHCNKEKLRDADIHQDVLQEVC